MTPEAKGQPPDASQETPPLSEYNVRIDVNSVFLNVSVRDQHNRSIPHLQKEDFRVYEDGAPQEIQQLISDKAPFDVLLLLDNSGSTQSYLALIKNAAIDFTNRMKPDDHIAVAAFNSLVDLMQPFSDDRAQLKRAIERILSIGGTALYDSLLLCINRYMRNISGRSGIVVFTDGFDNQLEGPNSEGSRTPFSALYRRIQEIEPIIYTIFLNTGHVQPVRDKPSRRPFGRTGWPWPRPPASQSQRPTKSSILETAKQHLLMIAEQTGGRMYLLTSVETLSSAYAEIADDLGACYRIAYNPTHGSRDGKWHQIQVGIRGRPEAVVRTRKGYYAVENEAGH
jgi:VWFA-related protein